MSVHRNILIATDGSKLANKAVDYALHLSAELQASVVIVTVGEPAPPLLEGVAAAGTLNFELRTLYEKENAKLAVRILKRAEKKAQNRALFCLTEYVQNKKPYVGIIETAKKHKCDLIVMASHGHTGIKKLLLGSQALGVLNHSKIPVLIVR